MWKGGGGGLWILSTRRSGGLPRLALRRRLPSLGAGSRQTWLGSLSREVQGNSAWTCPWVSPFPGEGDVRTCQKA